MFYYVRVRVDLTEEGTRTLRETRGLAPDESLNEAVRDEVFTAVVAAGVESGYWETVRVT